MNNFEYILYESYNNYNLILNTNTNSQNILGDANNAMAEANDIYIGSDNIYTIESTKLKNKYKNKHQYYLKLSNIYIKSSKLKNNHRKKISTQK